MEETKPYVLALNRESKWDGKIKQATRENAMEIQEKPKISLLQNCSNLVYNNLINR